MQGGELVPTLGNNTTRINFFGKMLKLRAVVPAEETLYTLPKEALFHTDVAVLCIACYNSCSAVGIVVVYLI